MDCKTYRELYPSYSDSDRARRLWAHPKYKAFARHLLTCTACEDWTMARQVESRGACLRDYPCVHIAYYVTRSLVSEHEDPFDDPDVTIWKFEDTQTYGIPIRDGGSSIIEIKFCPWCSMRLT